MKGTFADAQHEWFQFNDPDDENQAWRVHIGFMMSNWRCLFGDGCPGCFGAQSEHTFDDMGCCGHGAYINSKKEVAHLQERVDLLTEEDLTPDALAYIKRKGWLNIVDENPDEDDEDAIVSKTRLRDRGCVFQNRADKGKTGCAFVHLGNRLGQPDHIDNMPQVCWQLPIVTAHNYDEKIERNITDVAAWDADYWGGMDEDGTHDSWMKWWCTDTPDAYTGTSHVYLTMERELRAVMGDKPYEILREYLDKRDPGSVLPMPGSVVNDGRPLLPLLVGNRTPKRSPKST